MVEMALWHVQNIYHQVLTDNILTSDVSCLSDKTLLIVPAYVYQDRDIEV